MATGEKPISKHVNPISYQVLQGPHKGTETALIQFLGIP